MNTRGFRSDVTKSATYRVWALGQSVLIDADDEDEARAEGRLMLGVPDADVDTVERLTNE